MINKVVCLLVLIQGLSIDYVTPENIPPVYVRKHIAKGHGFTLQWDPVKRLDQNDPIIGYKIKVWEAPCTTETVNKSVNGTLVKEVIGFRKEFDPYAIPDETPLYVYIFPADKLEGTVPEVLFGVWYHVRMLAFTNTVEGEHSKPIQFAYALNNEYKDHRCSLNQTSSPVTDEEEIVDEQE